MSTIQALRKRALFFFRLIIAILGRLCSCFKRRKNIGELPYTVANRNPQAYWKSALSEEQWKGWSDTPFVTSVEEKIIEYRRKKAGPEAYIGNYHNISAQSSNLFGVETDQLLPSHLNELGSLEDTNTHDEAENWDTQIDIEGVDNALREQRAKERQERRLARQMEHAKRFERRKE
uniref:Receptor-binding cancer antigen expressed on SiSo cells n=1 Tax=Loa loa TaxID=7209 RepID=A0A1I7VFI6_LOALO